MIIYGCMTFWPYIDKPRSEFLQLIVSHSARIGAQSTNIVRTVVDNTILFMEGTNITTYNKEIITKLDRRDYKDMCESGTIFENQVRK